MSPDQPAGPSPAPGGSVPAGSLAPGYRLVGRVWRGADATSYRAVRESDQRDVLLTVPVTPHAMGEVAERLRRLPPRLPQLAEVLAEGRTGAGLPFLAIAYHPDPSYEEHVAESGPVPAGEVARVGIAVAGGLDAMHRAGIGHGAVSATNILRRPDGPLLTGYAPWSAGAEPPDPRADLADLAAALRRLLGEDPPAWLQAVLERATSPADRYPDAAAFAAALRAGPGGPQLATPEPPHPAPPQPELPQPEPEPEPPPQPEPVAAGAVGAGAVAAGAERRRAARSWVEVRPRKDSGSAPPLPPVPVGAGGTPASGAATPAWLADLEATLDGLPAAGGQPPGRPRDGRRRDRRRRAGRLGWLALACVAAFAVGLAGTYAVTRGTAGSADPDPPVAQPAATAPASPEPAPPAPAPPGPAGVPVDLVVADDESVAVTLSWRNQGGEVPLTVIGGPVGSESAVLGSAAPGDTTVRINGLNPQLEYCFRMVAASSVDDDGVGVSEQVCTARG